MPTPPWWGELLGASQVLADRDRAEVDDWRDEPETDDPGVPREPDEDDVPPLTVRLGMLSHAFTDNAPMMSSEERRRILGVLEHVMAAGSHEDSTAVGTGFLEGMLAAWDRGFDLHAVWDELGPESQSFCRSLNEFWGIESPDWMCAV
ncbi:hypothetical protein BX264_5502 [Streptomyces sp. 2333.5]|uniref:DUF7674 family protein n=1 Tax=Streptomyces TaxID=1883 RepID=UPI00089A95AC|nr:MULTISPECIES: hypothetical protein [unclassified Streptomyces]PJJ05049.1 hypothetical protein BX264_5502 [Streptomyces sp. 2333.5]SEE66908.1 hypothetical protein SAMN05428943_5604 [Streptomyces sp. 2314.4]SEE93196.1 hypothetical protein SAMN05428942_5600 [Streptomyces sp. 2112.2]